jgi:hypothetical protein
MRLEHRGLSCYLLGGTLVGLGLRLFFSSIGSGGWLQNIMEREAYLLFSF